MTTARSAISYRAARRNRCKQGGWNPTCYFVGSKKAHAHRGAARYVPYKIKPDRFKFVALPVPDWARLKPRWQPNVYREPSQREQARRVAITKRFMQGVI